MIAPKNAPPTHPAFAGATCEYHDTPLVVRGKILVCETCQSEFGGHYGKYYTRQCVQCGKRFLTRAFQQARCGGCTGTSRYGA